jgi:hypothetical protein
MSNSSFYNASAEFFRFYIERTKDFTSQVLCASITIVIIAEIQFVRCKIISAIYIDILFTSTHFNETGRKQSLLLVHASGAGRKQSLLLVHASGAGRKQSLLLAYTSQVGEMHYA